MPPLSFPAHQLCEWGKPRLLLLAEPGTEILLALLAPRASNFLAPFNLRAAQAEHRIFRRTLERTGARVLDLRQALILGTLTEEGEIRPGRPLERLRRLVRRSIRLTRPKEMEWLHAPDIELDFQRVLTTLHPLDLAELALLRPTLEFTSNPKTLDNTTIFNAQFHLRPASNQLFLRDAMQVTAKGVVIGRSALEIRRPEATIVATALAQMRIRPLLKVQSPGILEGGDFLPAGAYALQGQGLLTNREGVRQLLDAGAYGFVEVGVVIDPNPRMESMHLDTWFAFLSPTLALMTEDRFRPGREPVVEIWQPQGTTEPFHYRNVGEVPFRTYLDEKGVELISCSIEEQQAFAPNFLLLGKRRPLGVRNAGESFWNRLRERGVKPILLDFPNLTHGYGGPHCLSQVLLRDPA